MIALIPMAGKGNRFLEEKYNVPKPFISIMGKPMFVTALRSFPPADSYLFVAREEHASRLNRQMGQFDINGQVIVTEKVTEGQACTCLLARDRFKSADGLFIASCDYQTIYDKARYEAMLADDSIDVIIWTFRIGSISKANPHAFAYCRMEGDRVVEVVEKRTISDTPQNDPAVVGSFTYKRADDFIRGAEKMIENNIRVNNEFYVGTSINQLIAEGKRVAIFEVNKFISFGNPFELQLFDYWEDYFQKEADPRRRYGFV